MPESIDCIDGRLFDANIVHELVVGTDLARALSLQVGTVIPPFYRNKSGERLSRVVGLFRSDIAFWQARVVFTSFESAAAIFHQRGLATDLLVDCRPGYDATVSAAIGRMAPVTVPGEACPVRMQTITRKDLLGECHLSARAARLVENRAVPHCRATFRAVRT